MRGVRHVVGADAWIHIKESELKPLIIAQEPEKLYDIPEECLEPVHLNDDVELDSTSSTAYDAAIDRLHWSFARTDASQPQSTHR